MTPEEYQNILALKLEYAFGTGPIGPAPIIKAMADVAASHEQLIEMLKSMRLSAEQWKIVDEAEGDERELEYVLSQ